MGFSRRHLLAVMLLPALPAAATPEALAAAIRAHTGGVPTRSGRITIEIAELVENGNTVPLSLSVQSPMSAADHVRSLAVFTERNPQPEVAVFHFSPRSGQARVHTRIRLATSQPLVAVATMNDGSVWQHQVDVMLAQQALGPAQHRGCAAHDVAEGLDGHRPVGDEARKPWLRAQSATQIPSE